MTASPQTARKEVFALIAAGWAAGSPAIVNASQAPEMRYQGVEKGDLPGANQFWARASTQLATSRQAAFALVGQGATIPVYETTGVVAVQIFAPMSAVASYAKGELLAELAQCMFMASETPSGVWFRNPRINELPPDGTWYRWNVLTDFQFNQTKGN